MSWHGKFACWRRRAGQRLAGPPRRFGQRFLILNRARAAIIEVSLKKPLAFCWDERWGARFRRRGDARPAGAGRLRTRLFSGRRARAVAARGGSCLHEVGRGQARRRRGADRADPGARHLRRRFSAQGFRARRAARHELRRSGAAGLDPERFAHAAVPADRTTVSSAGARRSGARPARGNALDDRSAARGAPAVIGRADATRSAGRRAATALRAAAASLSATALRAAATSLSATERTVAPHRRIRSRVTRRRKLSADACRAGGPPQSRALPDDIPPDARNSPRRQRRGATAEPAAKLSAAARSAQL